MKESLKVGVSGVRGIVGESFTPQLALTFAQAFGAFVGRGSVVVGRDTRTSGSMVEHAVMTGLQSVGCKPVSLGIVPTPTVLVCTLQLGARGGIAITASHNPSPWNALKFVEPTGLFLNESRAEELLDIYHQGGFPLVGEGEIPSVQTEERGMEFHVKRILNYVDQSAIEGKRFKVAVDCCNGVGAVHSRKFLEEKLGCQVITIFNSPSGIFEREPEPLPQNLVRLSKTVVEHECAIGFAQDPDGDRLALINEKGEPLGEDFSLAFAVQQILDHHEKGSVAMNLSTSKCVEWVARKRGCEVIRTKIGEVNVSEAMIRSGCVVGGEGSGGVIIPKIHPCRDSYAAMAIVLELMAATGKKISELRSAIPQYVMAKEKIHVSGEKAPGILRKLRRHYESQGHRVNLLDGIYVDLGESWINIRRSNTEPVIRVTSEAQQKDIADRLVAEAKVMIHQGVLEG